MPGPLSKPKDTQDDRRYMRLQDQHGRTWGCVIELKTGDPTGPIDMLEPKRAPVQAPPRYLKVDSRKEYGRITIDYDGWAGMLRRAREHYDREVGQKARQMYGDAAAQKVEDPKNLPAPLLDVVGPAPEPVEPVLAAQHGDPWILGLTDVRPPWADLFFPLKPKVKKALPDELAFLNHGRQDETSGHTSDESYPAFVKSAGRGVSVWGLSDGTEFTGKKADAVAAQEALAVASHSSWGE